MQKIDAHVHFGPAPGRSEREALSMRMLEDMDNAGVNRFAIQVPEFFPKQSRAFRLEEALWFKDRYPERVYVFGGLRFSRFDPDDERGSGLGLKADLEELIKSGCDGLKLLFGKPDVRKALGVPLDADLFRPLFEKLEETRFPVLWHIADPPEFWDSNPAPVPLWAAERNWSYDDTHPGFEQIKREAENVFTRHPGLNLTLAHFYFMSDDLVAAAEFLERHPNIMIDTAPGVEMCHNCSKNINAARDFFIRFDRRIIYGTDSGMDRHRTSFGRSRMVQEWLVSDGWVEVPADDPFMMPDVRDRFRGLNLPPASLERIWFGNFRRFIND